MAVFTACSDPTRVPTFTVSFDLNGGIAASPPTPQVVDPGSSITLPGASGLSKSGYTFGGWNTRADGYGTHHSAGSTFTPQGNITLYARWVSAFIVTFGANGGTGTVPAQAVGRGSSMILPNGEELSRSGFAFAGWNTRADGGGFNYEAGAVFTSTDNTNLFARWVPSVAFTVTFSANGGVGTAPVPRTVNEGAAMTLPYGDGLSRHGFTFAGWNTNAAGTGSNFDAGAPFTPAGNMTLFARWNPVEIFTVSFNTNGGTGAVPAQAVGQGFGITLPSGDGISRPGHTFAGWNTNAAGTGLNFPAGATFTPTGNITLYARWVAAFTVSFNANGGTGVVPAQAVGQGSSMILPSGDGLLRPGYAFVGWNTNATGAGVNHDAGSIFTPTGNLTLYARWATVFVPVTDITGVPTATSSGTPLALTGTVVPADATNRTIAWSVQNAGTTGATITGSTLNTTGTGTVTVRATIADGIALGTPFTRDFAIAVNPVPVTDITGVPTSATAGMPLALTGTVVPAHATNRTIVWSVQNAGTTVAAITGNTFNTTGAGTVTVRATIADGIALGTPFTMDFPITVTFPPGDVSITITFADFYDMTTILEQTISLRNPPSQTSTLNVANPGDYDPGSIRWFLNGVEITGGAVSGTNGGTLALGSDILCTGIRTHLVTVEVRRGGVPFSQVITVRVVP